MPFIYLWLGGLVLHFCEGCVHTGTRHSTNKKAQLGSLKSQNTGNIPFIITLCKIIKVLVL